MGLFKGLTERANFRVVSGFQSGNFGSERGDDVVVCSVVSRGWLRWGSVLSPLVFDPRPELLVVVEKCMGDAGFVLDGLECDRFAAFDQAGDGGIG